MTEIEYAVDATTVLSGTLVIVDDKDLVGLSPAEIKSLIIDKAIKEDNWIMDDEDDVSYEVSEN
tara:strand:+ start:479 stop:670 length:192 start_codon:yes stop_codon:yes gene_type:complete